MYQQIWCEHFVPCWISFTWPSKMFMIQILYKGWTMRSTSFISTAKYLFRRVFARRSQCPPRQHSLMHYTASIRAFGAPNGLCSSITENKHIQAVKEPLTNQQLDKLAASRTDFANHGMLNGTCLSGVLARLGDHSLFYDCISHSNASHCRGSS